VVSRHSIIADPGLTRSLTGAVGRSWPALGRPASSRSCSLNAVKARASRSHAKGSRAVDSFLSRRTMCARTCVKRASKKSFGGSASLSARLRAFRLWAATAKSENCLAMPGVNRPAVVLPSVRGASIVVSMPSGYHTVKPLSIPAQDSMFCVDRMTTGKYRQNTGKRTFRQTVHFRDMSTRHCPISGRQIVGWIYRFTLFR
jgi:hypothetical protein